MKSPAEIEDEEIVAPQKRLHEVEGQPALFITGKSHGAPEDIYFTQKDVREVHWRKPQLLRAPGSYSEMG